MPTQGEILRDLRLERKMTMQELADYLKVSKQTINSWEKDFRKYDVETLFKLADFFNVSVDYLLDRETNTNSYNLDNVYLSFAKYAQDNGIDAKDIELAIKTIQEIRKKH